jgi:hypothetical protein
MKRQMIEAHAESLDDYFFEGDLQGLINKLVEIQNRLIDDGFQDLIIHADQYGEHTEYSIRGNRPETDRELTERKKKREKVKADKEKAKQGRFKRYQELKIEFEQ